MGLEPLEIGKMDRAFPKSVEFKRMTNSRNVSEYENCVVDKKE